MPRGGEAWASKIATGYWRILLRHFPVHLTRAWYPGRLQESDALMSLLPSAYGIASLHWLTGATRSAGCHMQQVVLAHRLDINKVRMRQPCMPRTETDPWMPWGGGIP